MVESHHEVFCHRARERGAIGEAYAATMQVEGADRAKAETLFREHYETFAPVFVFTRAESGSFWADFKGYRARIRPKAKHGEPSAYEMLMASESLIHDYHNPPKCRCGYSGPPNLDSEPSEGYPRCGGCGEL